MTNSYSIYSNNEAVSRIYSRQRNVRPYWCDPAFSCPSFSSTPNSSPSFFCPANSTPASSSVIFQSCKYSWFKRLNKKRSLSLVATCESTIIDERKKQFLGRSVMLSIFYRNQRQLLSTLLLNFLIVNTSGFLPITGVCGSLRW